MALRVDAIEDMIPVADFIADMMGESAEIVLHDVQDSRNSIRYIRNGHLTGRKVGDGMTDVAMGLVHRGQTSDGDYMANYKGKALGEHEFRCSTFFVKNHQDELIGLLCVNVSVDGLAGAIDTLASFLCGGIPDASHRYGQNFPRGLEENLLGNPEETIRSITRRAVETSGIDVRHSTSEERLGVFAKISEDGVFLIKGSAQIVADEMGITLPTVYKYLKAIKEES